MKNLFLLCLLFSSTVFGQFKNESTYYDHNEGIITEWEYTGDVRYFSVQFSRDKKVWLEDYFSKIEKNGNVYSLRWIYFPLMFIPLLSFKKRSVFPLFVIIFLISCSKKTIFDKPAPKEKTFYYFRVIANGTDTSAIMRFQKW